MCALILYREVMYMHVAVAVDRPSENISLSLSLSPRRYYHPPPPPYTPTLPPGTSTIG